MLWLNIQHNHTQMLKIGLWVVALLLAVSPKAHADELPDCAQAQLPQQAYQVTVALVDDGDTFTLRSGERVRLIGINTPELEREAWDDHPATPAQPLAHAAKVRLAQLLGQGVFLLNDRDTRDTYQRLLAHPYTPQGHNITRMLLAEGYGFAVTIAPNSAFAECYFVAEAEARSQRAGVWQEPSYAPVAASDLTQNGRSGFMLVEGVVQSVHASRRALWVHFEGELAVMIRHKYVPQFRNNSDWQGARFIARGWVIDRGPTTKPWHKRWLLSVSHPSMLERLD